MNILRQTVIAIALVIAGVAVLLSPVQAAETKTVAFIGFTNSVDQPFWIAMAEAVKMAAEKKNILLLDLTPTSADPQEQRRLLEYALDARKVDGIILGANNVEVLVPALDKALANGVPIVAVDTAVHHPAVKSLVATDNLASAGMMGEYIARETGGKGTVLILGGTKGHPNGDARHLGVEEKVLKAGMKVIFRYADWQVEQGYAIAEEELSRPNDIVAVFACNDPVALGAQRVVAQKNLRNRILIAGFDGLQSFYKAIEKGNAAATIVQPVERMAQESLEMLLGIFDGKKVPAEELIPGILVDKNNVAGYLR